MKGVSFLVLLATVGCGVKNVTDSDTSNIIGANDLRSVAANGENLPERFRNVIDAVGRMSMGCTGTHIGNGLVLSAGHCFANTSSAQAICNRTYVQFGYRKGVAPYLTTRCVEIVSMQLTSRKDYVLFRVATVPKAKMEVSLTVPQSGTTVTIFGHPQGRRLEWSQNCSLQDSRNILYSDIAHRCDTEPGSSGSVIIDANTLEVVGIHNGATGVWNWQQGRYVPWNYGTFLGATPSLVTALTNQ